MASVVIPRGLVRELSEIDTALRAALGAKYAGSSMRGDEITLHLAEGATPEEIAQARSLAVSEAGKIDPLQPTPAQKRIARIEAAMAALRAADLNGLRQRVAAANSVQALRAEVELLARTVQRLAVLAGFNDQDEV